MATGVLGEEWAIVWTQAPKPEVADEVRQMTGITDLAAAEDDLGITPRTPIFVRPDLTLDDRLCQFVHRSKFRSLAPATRESYALDIRLLLNFLALRGVDWSEACADDVEAFEHWRRRHRDNPSRISGAKWVRERAAIRMLYGWADSRSLLTDDPSATLSKPRNVRSSRVRWLTPRALKVWKRVGLLGYGPDGLRDPAWVSEVDDRNAGLVDLIYASGLRIQEAGSLTTLELPDGGAMGRSGMASAFVASACAKGGRRRQFWVTASAQASVADYVAITRRYAVQSANASGRYDKLTDVRRVLGYNPASRVIRYVDSDGVEGRVNLDMLSPRERARYFQEGPDGLDPLAVWLNTAGRPINFRTWTENVFPAANRRCARLGVKVDCTPHMLRHSFALRMLVALEYAMSARGGMTPEERRREDILLGSPFDLVRDLLGHASTATTRRHYLEPLAGLRIEHLLGSEDDDDLQRIMARIAGFSPLIQDFVVREPIEESQVLTL
jgi:site-specific recombinase XerD